MRTERLTSAKSPSKENSMVFIKGDPKTQAAARKGGFKTARLHQKISIRLQSTENWPVKVVRKAERPNMTQLFIVFLIGAGLVIFCVG